MNASGLHKADQPYEIEVRKLPDYTDEGEPEWFEVIGRYETDPLGFSVVVTRAYLNDELIAFSEIEGVHVGEMRVHRIGILPDKGASEAQIELTTNYDGPIQVAEYKSDEEAAQAGFFH